MNDSVRAGLNQVDNCRWVCGSARHLWIDMFRVVPILLSPLDHGEISWNLGIAGLMPLRGLPSLGVGMILLPQTLS